MFFLLDTSLVSGLVMVDVIKYEYVGVGRGAIRACRELWETIPLRINWKLGFILSN